MRALAAQIAALILLSAHAGIGRTASFSVTSDPLGASVHLDGAVIGATPVVVEQPGTGSHRIRLSLPGYLEHARTVDFGVQPNASLHVQLTPDSSATTGNWFTRRRWVWIAAAGGGAGAALILSQRGGPLPAAGSVVASPPVGLQSGTAISFASQGASVESGDRLDYSWEFGDGRTASGPLVTHVYDTTGSFTARLTVTAGKKSAAVSGSPVSIRSLTGTWRGTLAGTEAVLVLAQSGANVTGTYRDPAGTGAVTGTVGSTSPRVNLTITAPAYSATFAADPDIRIDELKGTYREQGLILALSITRQ